MAEAETRCRFWLARQKGNTVTLEDGCHDGPEGVAKAAKLIEHVFGDKGPWVMVELHPLPDLDPEINEKAAQQCAHLVAWIGPRGRDQMTGERKPYEDEAVGAFLVHCDKSRLTYEEGLVLAEKVAEATQAAAEDRAPSACQGEEEQRG